VCASAEGLSFFEVGFSEVSKPASAAGSRCRFIALELEPCAEPANWLPPYFSDGIRSDRLTSASRIGTVPAVFLPLRG
jgi:hypothetical protein